MDFKITAEHPNTLDDNLSAVKTELIKEEPIDFYETPISSDQWTDAGEPSHKIKEELSTDGVEHTSSIGSYAVIPFICNLCQNSFEKLEYLRQHLLTHTNDALICDICLRQFKTRSALTRHINTHLAKTRFKCNFCNQGFPVRSNLKNHTRIHTGEKPYNCDICHLSFRTKSELSCHKLKHSYDNPLKCNVCNMGFNTNFCLNLHKRTHGTVYNCKFCKLQFTSESHLNSHELAHSKGKIFVSDCCNRNFVSRTDLKKHICKPSRNLSKALSVCNECSMRFSDNEDLVAHRRLKECRCQVCGEWFTNRCALVCHQNARMVLNDEGNLMNNACLMGFLGGRSGQQP